MIYLFVAARGPGGDDPGSSWSVRKTPSTAEADEYYVGKFEYRIFVTTSTTLYYSVDAVSRTGRDFGERFIELARSVYTLNDRRAAVKRQINQAKSFAIIDEKSY